MRFRSVPPDPAEFPWFGLVWPGLIPLALAGVLWLIELSGHVWNVHGADLLALFAFAVSIVFALALSVVALFSAVPALRAHPTLRSRRNVSSTVFGAVCALGCAVFIAVAVYGVVRAE